MAESKPLVLTLVRTGLTSWEQAGRLAGGVDVPLCPEAAAGCAGLAREAATSRPTLILHGSDSASKATAEAIEQATGAKVRELEDLDDPNLGLWAGLAEESLEERSPAIWRLWREDPTAVRIPEGEQIDAAADRVIGCLAKALGKAKGGSSVTVVLRPMAFGMVRCWLDALPLAGLWQAVEGPAVDRREVAKERLKKDRSEA